MKEALKIGGIAVAVYLVLDAALILTGPFSNPLLVWLDSLPTAALSGAGFAIPAAIAPRFDRRGKPRAARWLRRATYSLMAFSMLALAYGLHFT